ncbi:hypothetical protein [Saccharopolyspora sp. NPDC002686]|uniref:hypothetical protein n=1 Tax=Saccharopolyspora sp. NPDC002686 TaxID=3154541 RepID=UPI00332EDD67
MTEPGGLGPEEQKELLDEMAGVVTAAAPENWQLIAVEFLSVGRHVEMRVGVRDSNGNPVSWEPPAEVDNIFWRLRVGMYQEGIGTWYTSMFRISPPDTYEVLYNRDNEPPWNPPAEAFAKEQELFPRDEQHMPDWFRQRLA